MDKEKRDTFELLYKTHYKELYIHALSFVRDEEEAKDIVTDVYEYVWKNFEKLDSSVSLRPFPPFFARPNRHHQIQQRWKAHGCAPSAPSLNAAPEAFLRPFCRSPQSDWPTELRRYHVYPEP